MLFMTGHHASICLGLSVETLLFDMQLTLFAGVMFVVDDIRGHDNRWDVPWVPSEVPRLRRYVSVQERPMRPDLAGPLDSLSAWGWPRDQETSFPR